MPLIERYILRRTARVFVFSLCALTGAGWVTQVLERLDVVTAKGQAILVFLLMTISVLPAVIQVVAPIAFLLAVIITLNSLTNDSELPIIAAAGGPPRSINRPIVVLGVVVMLGVAASYHVLTPAGLNLLRTILTNVRSDVIATLVQGGGFRSLENGLTMHFRERTPDGGFSDVFISDERDPEESRVFSAARGLLLENAGGSFLVLQNGDLIQEDRANGDGSVVTFDTYAVDLRQIGSAGALPVFRAIERSTFYLMNPRPEDPYSENYPLKVRAEIYDRLSAPLYVLVFAFIALGYLGRPRTNRQDRRLAIAAVVLICLGLRAGGYAIFVVGGDVSGVTPFIHVVPLAGLAFGIYASRHDSVSRIPAGIGSMIDAIVRAGKRMLGREMMPADMSDSA